MKKLLTIAAALVAAAFTINAGQVQLAWDASPTPGVTNYVLNVTQGTNTARVNVGPALTAEIETTQGVYSVFCTAQKDGVESEPSNTVIFEVPAPPSNARIVAVEHSITLTNGWNDVGFFRLKFTP